MFKILGIAEELLEVTAITDDNDERKQRRNRRAKRNDITVEDILKEFASNDNPSTDDDEPDD